MTAPRPPVGGGPVRLGPRIVGEPVRTPWDQTDEAPAPTVLDDLGDVEVSQGDVGVLTRDGSSSPARFRAISYRHAQAVAVEQWLIAHGLHFTPAGVEVTGAEGQRVHPRAIAHTPGQTRLDFAFPVAGTADLS